MGKLSAFITGFIFTSILMLLLVVIVFYFTSPQYYNVLVIGSDQRGTERARSDVLFVVSVPKKGDQQPFFLSIPRDTKIEDEEYGLQKITHFYALGERPDDGKLLGNVELTRAQVEQLVGIEMDATVEVTFGSFEEIIDSVGGVTLDGKTVNGQEALKVVRDRFTEGRTDFDRQADERAIFRGLITKLKKPEEAKALLAYFEESENARIDFKKVKLIRFAVGAGIARKGKLSIGEMEESSVPGHSERIYTPQFGKSLYYWIADEAALSQIVEDHFK
jgi:polyisoprenyl-teichoic acid--peptidoglycan teichoic acid transferase